MEPLQSSHYSIYRTVIDQVMEGKEQLPSLPSLTLKIRQAINNPNTTNSKLAQLVEKDPALCAMLMKYASSPLYRTQESPGSLEKVISILGLSTVDNVLMLHSVKSLFVMNKPSLTTLYKLAWKRLITKAAFSTILAEILKYRPTDQVMITSLLTEIGTLAVLSALNNLDEVPDKQSYFDLCRQYSKSLGVILLRKWAVGDEYVEILRHLGEWQYTPNEKINCLDIINLGLYQALIELSPETELPNIQSLVAFTKLPPALNFLDKEMRLEILLQKKDEINSLISALN